MAEGGMSGEVQSISPAFERQKQFETDAVADLGNARILAFAPPEGFRLENTHQYARTDHLSIDYPAREINEANRREAEYHREHTTAQPLGKDFEFQVGLLDVKTSDGVLSFKTKPRTFVMGNDDAIGLQAPTEKGIEMRSEFGIPLATAVIVFTTESDGSQNMILARRSEKNMTYKSMLSASAAGLNEHTINRRTGALDPLGETEQRKFALKELSEEIGVESSDIVDGPNGLVIHGLGLDARRVHLEMLMSATVNVSAEEMRKRVSENLLKEGRKPFDFAEDAFVLPGTLEDIWKVCTLKTPIPPTHTAALVSAGRMMVLQKEGPQKALEWTESLAKEIRKTTEEIDQKVRDFTNGKESGYNPRLTPQEQGLQTAESALMDAGYNV